MKKVWAAVLTVCLFVSLCAVAPSVRASGDQHTYLPAKLFKTFGSWRLTGTYLTGLASEEAGDPSPAIAELDIAIAGDYKVWVRDRDFATNQPGTRTFGVAVDGVPVSELFGDHGQEGFRWSEVGVFTLSAGVHELSLLDTSGFYARSAGFFVSDDLNLVPPEDEGDLLEIVEPADPLSGLPSAEFPAWATDDVTPSKSDSIENDSVKVVFHQGTGTEGALVQNEIFIKSSGQWVAVKDKTDALGFLMMSALHTELGGMDTHFARVLQRVAVGGGEASAIADDYFHSGVPVWFIPSDYTKLGSDKVELTFPNTEADLTVTFELDALTDDPKVTLNAEFAEDGAYSFLLYSGEGVDEADYDTVTAPMLYVKHAVPDHAGMIPESYLFTPMASLHFSPGESPIPGQELTSGIVMDPESVPQGYTYPDTSHFGLVLRDETGHVRPQFAAPLFGTTDSLFEDGDDYEVSYRIVNRTASWFDTLKHVTEEMYNFADLRSNVYHSVNEAIYNATDLMLDDQYGGWDPEQMAHYNMEAQDVTTMSNAMAAVQRYLLTEDEDILDTRAVPTLAFLLSRLNYHFKNTDSTGGANSYVSDPPSAIGGPVTRYTTSVYGGLYEMTQGRMPFLLDTGLHAASGSANLSGVADQAAMYKYVGDPIYLNKAKQLADQYLANNPNTGANRDTPFISSFVYGDTIPMVTAFLAAYELTGDTKYLEAAEESGELLATSVWTTGYHNGYDTSSYTVDPVDTAARKRSVDWSSFFWHGSERWRLGNIDGEAKPPSEVGPPLQEETAPGWVVAKAGMGTEHTSSPTSGNIISMNNWAGNLVKLSEYTGDPYFETMARNAMIGRFGNYPGYYQDRSLLHHMKDDYPYVGPEYTSIYYHHIPVFISMLEDFLINSAWAKSERHISFPSIVQSGYAYFASNQFGHAPGTFYGDDDMWLWLDRGIIEPDTPDIDYLAARKDGKLGLALMNESGQTVTSAVYLGDKVAGGSVYTGTATVYEADGTAATLPVVDGVFTVEIPAKGIRSVLLELPGVEAPAYADANFAFSNVLRDTVSEHTRGKGHVIQISPESYHAYVYVSDMEETTTKLTMHYDTGGGTQTVEKTGYPFEFLIKVDDPEDSFTYTLEATKTDAQVEQLGGGTLQAYDGEGAGIVIPEAGRFDPIELDVISSGKGGGKIRLVVSTDDFPFALTDNLLSGLRITGTLTSTIDSTELELDSILAANEVRTNGTTVLVVDPTAEVPFGDYGDYEIAVTIHPREQMGYFEPLEPEVLSSGSGGGKIRMVVSAAEFPFTVYDNVLSGLRIAGTLTSTVDSTELELDSVISSNELRTNGTTVLLVDPTDEVPYTSYTDYTFDVTIYPIPDTEPPVTTATILPGASAESGGVYDGPVTVTMVATDDWSGVADTVYRLGGGAWSSYNAPLIIDADGSHTVEYYSTDVAGNAESAKGLAVQIESE
ncbi:hypothetical protein IDH44_01260 [Paenibacillus sp. IB182496]|uniref:Uncharacterized protein n=1 Tax=Paenibacillus sabuli TaxID=2772509 RepID=A0A927BQF9_9BACL|nr:hypothetical protein [Paenibacillus sabuli]MBD2843805.1 hypothetical protein [Paenibacillus sabuli]